MVARLQSDPNDQLAVDALTQGAFELLLARLDTERQQAGIKYELLRRKLMKFFEWRGCTSAEDLADETIDRVAKNLEAGEEIRNLAAYCAGTARNVFLEALRARRQEMVVEDLPARSTDLTEASERCLYCLERCLKQLSSADGDLILRYYRSETSSLIRSRKDLAKQLGLPLNALRIRTHRIRIRLEDCVETCTKGSAGK